MSEISKPGDGPAVILNAGYYIGYSVEMDQVVLAWEPDLGELRTSYLAQRDRVVPIPLAILKQLHELKASKEPK